jgi:hypothetical protein
MKMERRESTRDEEREKSRSKTSSKPAMAGLYTLSRAPPAARPVPARPARSHRKDVGARGGKREEDGVFFSPFSFGSLLFFFQCLGNSLVTWGTS